MSETKPAKTPRQRSEDYDLVTATMKNCRRLIRRIDSPAQRALVVDYLVASFPAGAPEAAAELPAHPNQGVLLPEPSMPKGGAFE